MTSTAPKPARASIASILVAWAILQIGGLFTPGLLDDVDSVYIEIAREMLHRHDFVTPFIDGIRFFDKPPLLYWLAAASMRLLGEHDWAARLPLALGMLGLLLATYALALRLFQQERAALYSALALATSVGPYLYTRFYIPDILIALWMTLSVHAFLVALDRLRNPHRPGAPSQTDLSSQVRSPNRSALIPCLLFAATLALNLLTKGLIGIVFPLAFVLVFLAFTRNLRLLPRFHLIPSTLVLAAIALPWHILAALRNPAIPMPPGVGLPAKAGWAWFYLYNEHVARFLGKRIPHDYGLTPVWLFWTYAFVWIFPWAVFLPAALRTAWPRLKAAWAGLNSPEVEAALAPTLWAVIVLIFFSISNRQEYYSLPALPALALLTGGFLARAGVPRFRAPSTAPWSSAMDQSTPESRAALAMHRWLLLPIVSLVGSVCAFFAIVAPRPAPGTDLAALLSSNPQLYNLSLGHIFDLTGAAMGLFRAPLITVAVGMTIVGPVSYALRRTRRTHAANLSLAAGMIVTLLAAHQGLVRFNPILGSKSLALAIVAEEQLHHEPALVLLDGELTSGSTLLFYTRQPVHLVDGRVNGPWFGSFWPDAPPIFENEATLRQLWQGPTRIFLLTYNPASRTSDLRSLAPVRILSSAGGKTILTNR